MLSAIRAISGEDLRPRRRRLSTAILDRLGMLGLPRNRGVEGAPADTGDPRQRPRLAFGPGLFGESPKVRGKWYRSHVRRALAERQSSGAQFGINSISSLGRADGRGLE